MYKIGLSRQVVYTFYLPRQSYHTTKWPARQIKPTGNLGTFFGHLIVHRAYPVCVVQRQESDGLTVLSNCTRVARKRDEATWQDFCISR